jgi:hypothetical protein
MNPSIQKILETVEIDALAKEARRIPERRRWELQGKHATGSARFDLGLFAGLALAAMAEHARFCRQEEMRTDDPAFIAELEAVAASIESGQEKGHEMRAVLEEFEQERKATPKGVANGSRGEAHGLPSARTDN